MLKKFLSIFLITALLWCACPPTAMAQPTGNETAVSGSVTGECYLEPIAVTEDGIFQSGEALDTLTENGATLLPIDAVAQGSAVQTDGSVTLPTEEGAIVFTEGSSEALVSADGEETAVPLAAEVADEDGTLYAPIEDLAALCRLEAMTVDGTTVYAKPYQTKTLVVRANEVPACGAVDAEEADGYTVLSFASEADTQAAFEQLSDADGVTEVSCENVYAVSDYAPSDFPLNENLSWGADYIDSPQLVEYARETGLDGTVTVGIVDTGINTAHSFLQNRILPKSGSCVNSEPTVEDNNGHGSHVAGIITDNTPDNVKILAVKGLDGAGQGTDSQLAAGIRYAADNGAEILNMSFGGLDLFSASSVLKSALKYAYDKGVILVAAAGNESMDAANTVPANSQYCITVAATDALGEPAFFSNYGSVVNVAAPGVNINSSYKKSGQSDTYYRASGTSMATPFVVAACADAQLMNGKMRFADMKKYITSHVTPYGDSSHYYGTGIISLTDYCGVTRCAPPVFSELSGYYSEPMSVTLTDADSGAQIYYTTDGSAPSRENGTLYTEPLTVADDTQLKAVAYAEGKYKSATVKAQYQYSDRDIDANYIIDENGVITKYKGELTVLTVPDKIKGKTVTGIASNAFRSPLLLSIVLPDTVKEIPAAAFYGCASLSTVIARNAVKIGNDAFSGCNIRNITVGKVTAIGDDAFNGNVNLNEESLDFSALTKVGERAFYQCPLTALESDKLTEVGAHAFEETHLVSVKLDNLTALREGVFKGCTSLESAMLPKVTAVGKYAFQECGRLSAVTLPALTAIGDRAFYRCTALGSLPTDKVTSLGGEAFAGTAIASLNLQKLTAVPKAAFAYMTNLTDVTLPSQREVPEQCFYGDTALTAIPACFSGAETVKESAFENTGITAVSLPKAVTVKDGAFKNCTAVTAVSLPSCVFFGANGKLGAPSLTTLSLPKAITFGSVAGAPIRTAVLPSATSLGANAFSGCNQLQTVNAPNVQSLGSSAFKDCAALTTLCIQNFNGTIPGSCFYGCRALKEVFLPCAVSVGYNAFKDCTALQTVDLSAVTALDTAAVFADATALRHVIAPKAVTPAPHPQLDGTVALTNKTGETLNIMCGDALLEQVKNGSTLKLPAGSAVRVLYNGTFTVLKAGDEVLNESPITFDFTLNGATVLTAGDIRTLNAAEIGSIADVYYRGAAFTPVVTVKLQGRTLKPNTDYTLTMYNNTNAGTATAVYTGKGAYTGIKTLNFKIKPASVLNCTVAAIPDQWYTGKPIEPPVSVKIGNTAVSDYTVTYSDNVAVGTATVRITGKGNNLLDTKTVTFTIKKKETPPPAKNGWKYEGGRWYYYTNNVAAKGWRKVGGAWYYFNASGVMQTGWLKDGGKWYYLNASGAMATGWLKDGGKWYYLNASGAMLTGWQKLGGKWYYLNSGGDMATGWRYIGGKWYYFNSGGDMRTASLTQGGKTYYFNASGACTNP